MTKKFYLAGPMTGIPQFNFPLFIETTERLRKQGYDIISPVETDTPETRKIAMASETGDQADLPQGETWGTILAEDVKLVADVVDGIICLPGWKKSKGARLEVFVAFLQQKPIYQFDVPTGGMFLMYTHEVRTGIAYGR